jgi:predicted TIM-barrel fold metal-dependent hydrolase
LDLFDANCMIGRWPTERAALLTASDLLAEMDRLGIGRSLVCHTLAWQDSPANGNRRLMQEIAGQARLEPCWVLVPGEAENQPDGIAGLLAAMAAKNVRAVRLCPRDHVYPLTDWMTGELLAALNERQYVLLMDQDQVVLPVGLFDVDPTGWRQVAWLCQSFPALSVVLTRVGYRGLRVLLPLMAECPNLHLDLAYFATHQGVEEIMRRFGPERLLFATGQPLADAGGALARLYYAGVTEQQRDAIGHGNLERLLARVGVAGRGRRGAEPAPLPPQPRPDRPSPPASASAGRGNLAALAEAGRSLAEAGLEIVDGHGHLGPYRNFYIPEADADGMLRVFDRCGIARGAIAAHAALGPDWIAGNRLTAAAVAAHPDRLIGLAVADPHEPELIRGELADLFDTEGFRAIKLHPDIAAYSILDDRYRPAWEFAVERRCAVLCHTYHGSRFCDPQLFGTLAERYPEIPIVLVHSGAATAGFEGAIALARAHPNLYLDISGSFITGRWIKRMVQEVGADRVIFSSDIPFIDLRYSLGRVLYAGLSPAQEALVLGGNARHLLGLTL